MLKTVPEQLPNNLNNEHSFLLPENDLLKPTIHLKYGSTTRIFVTYPVAESLKEQLAVLKRTGIKRGKHPKENEIRTEYFNKCVANTSSLHLIWKKEKIKIKDEFTHLLGKTVQYKALGQDFNGSDRYFVRETLNEIFNGIGCLAEKIVIQMPIPLLQENIELNISDSDSIFYKDRSVCLDNISRSDIVMVITGPDGNLSKGTLRMLEKSTSFIKNLNCSNDHQLIFAPTLYHKIQQQQSTKNQSSKSITQLKQYFYDEFKKILSSSPNELYDISNNIENIFQNQKISTLYLDPLKFLVNNLNLESGITHQLNQGPRYTKIKESNILKTLHLLKVKAIMKCAAPLSSGLHLWMQRRRRYTFDANDKLDIRISQFLQLIKQRKDILVTLADKFNLTQFMRLKAGECCRIASEGFPQFYSKVTSLPNSYQIMFGKEHSIEFERELCKFTCRKLLEDAHSWWASTVLLEMPNIFKSFGMLSEQIMEECNNVIKNSTQIPKKQYCERVLAFWQSNTENSLPANVRKFKSLLYENADTIVPHCCSYAVHNLITEVAKDFTTINDYLKLINTQISAVPLTAANNIISGFKKILLDASNQLDFIYTNLKELQVKDSPDGLICTVPVRQTFQILSQKWKYSDYGSTSSWKDFIKVQLRESRYLDYVPQANRSQFHSAAHQIYCKESAHVVVRLLALDEILRHPEEYEQYIRDKTVNEYVVQMNNDNEKGDHVTLHAIANVFRVNILLYSPILPKNPIRIKSRHDSPIFDIRIGYLNQGEYNSLIPWKEDTTINTPEGSSFERFPKNIVKEHSTKKRKTFGSIVKVQIPSLVKLCITEIVDSMDMLPILEGALPEELVQPIITEIIARGKLNGVVLQKLLHEHITRLDLSNSRITNDICADVSSFCPHLREISLANCTNVSTEGVRILARNCSELQIIDLERCNIEDAAVSDLVSMCKHLVSINLAGCTKISSKELQQISCCPNLQNLSFKNCTQLTEDVFDKLSASLQMLDLSECDQITDNAVLKIARNSQCSLKSFKLSGKKITDVSLRHFVNTFPELEELELNGCDNISDSTVRSLASCKHLSILDLSSCPNITPGAFTPSKSQLRNLKELNLSSCRNVTDEALFHISKSSIELTVLNLSACEEITDEGLIQIATGCHSLRSLNLSSVFKITDKAIIELSNGCPRLANVILYRCRITDKAINALTNRCRAMELIDLSACENISDEAFKQFHAGFPSLQVLKLSDLNKITIRSMEYISQCPTIQELHLSRCKAVTPESIKKVAHGCPLIHTLDISNANILTVPDIQAALSLWGYMRDLRLKNYSGFSGGRGFSHDGLEELTVCWSSTLDDNTLIWIAQNCPRLKKVDVAWCKVTEISVKKLVSECPVGSINIRGTKVSPTSARGFSSLCSVIF